MGLVKFGQQTLTIDTVPDGSIILSESDYRRMTDTSNAYLSLKSRIPVGVDETQLGVLVEKGQRYDTVNQELVNTKTSLTDVQKKLETASVKLPEGFTTEKWNQLTQREQKEIRDGKISVHTKNVMEKLAKENPNVPAPEVDSKFLPADKVASFDPDAQNAEQTWATILAEGYKAQTEFLKKHQSSVPPTPDLGGAGGGSPAPTDAQISGIAQL